MKKLLWFFVTLGHANWITLSPVTTPVNSYTTQARPPAVVQNGGALWCVQDGVYLVGPGEMWKYEYDTQRWLWMVNTLQGPIKAYWNLGNTLYALTDRLWVYEHATRTWTMIHNAPALESPAVFWTDVESESLFLYTHTMFVKFEVVANSWAFIMDPIKPRPIAGSGGLVLTRDELGRWDSHSGWTWVTLSTPLVLTHMWRVSDNVAYGLCTLGETWQIDVHSGHAHTLGMVGFTNRANYTACTDQMVVFGGAPQFNDLTRFGTSPGNHYKGPVLIVGSATLAVTVLCLLILVTLCVVICIQQWRRKRAQMGPFVSGPRDVDFL